MLLDAMATRGWEPASLPKSSLLLFSHFETVSPSRALLWHMETQPGTSSRSGGVYPTSGFGQIFV